MSDIIPALERELSQLEAELRNDPRHQKIQQIKSLLAMYRNESGAAASAFRPFNPEAGRPDSKATRIREAIGSLLTQAGPQHRRDILAHLTTLGLMGHEKNPMASLAAYLSEWNGVWFESDGEGNWLLKPPASSASQAPRRTKDISS